MEADRGHEDLIGPSQLARKRTEGIQVQPAPIRPTSTGSRDDGPQGWAETPTDAEVFKCRRQAPIGIDRRGDLASGPRRGGRYRRVAGRRNARSADTALSPSEPPGQPTTSRPKLTTGLPLAMNAVAVGAVAVGAVASGAVGNDRGRAGSRVRHRYAGWRAPEPPCSKSRRQARGP